MDSEKRTLGKDTCLLQTSDDLNMSNFLPNNYELKISQDVTKNTKLLIAYVCYIMVKYK